MLVSAGEAIGVRGAGGLAILTARTEAGMIVGDGLDYGPDTSPWECGLGWTVSEAKRGYRGREAVLAARETAPLRLVTLRLDAEPDSDQTGTPVRDAAGAEIGVLGLVVPSPFAGAPLALARLSRDRATVGGRVTVADEIDAVIEPTPLYDPERRNVRS